MSIEIRPVGVTCQIRCGYCYESTLREAAPVNRYDREAVLAAMEKLPSFASLFGGEVLVLAFHHLEELLSVCHRKWGRSGMQTNGALITDKHIDLFVKYKTHVGISLDGPDDLNDSRWAGNLEATRKTTAKTHWAIKRLVERSKEHPHLLPSLIVTLHAGNMAGERFARFIKWLHELDEMGVRHVNIHVMEMDANARDYYMPENEYADRLIELWDEQPKFKHLRMSKFDEIERLLQGDDSHTVCIWRACDPWNTDAVQGIEHDGSASICSRNHKGSINWLPAEGSGVPAQFLEHKGARHYERQLALYVTPQEHGGCKDCEYWLACQGQCPGTAEDGDWRYRSSYCGVYKRLFAHGVKLLNARGIKTLPEWVMRPEMERRLYELWATNQPANWSIVRRQMNPQKHRNRPHTAEHGDHMDTVNPIHGDHNDNR